MGTSANRPKLAVIVANQITGDSRVQKTAIAAARAGWDVTLIGRSPGNRVVRSKMGAVNVVRLPVEKTMVRAENQRRRRSGRARLTQAGFPTQQLFENYDAAFRAELREREARLETLARRGTPAAATRRGLLKAGGMVRDKASGLRVRAYNWEERQRDSNRLQKSLGDWRRDAPQLLDLEAAFVPFLERLAPDVIHCNDITMINSAAVAVARLRSHGHTVSWLYDAHEYVAGVDWPTPRILSAYPAVERTFIHDADAVVTVSPEIAEVIRDENGLSDLPLVVRNTPIGEEAAAREGAPSVRAVAEVDDDVPLLVYSGYIHAERGLDRAIEALKNLPDFHLAIVAGKPTPALSKLQQLANELGVTNRVHVVPYVEPKDVPAYLSTADIGIICSHQTINYELSLPTKMAEYLHADLPVIASDLKTLSKFIHDHGVGMVFDPQVEGSFERAVVDLFPRRHEVAARITDELREELSWENQMTCLLDLYAELAGRRPEPPTQVPGWDLAEGPVRADRQTAGGDRLGPGDWRPLEAGSAVRLGLGPANYAGQLAAYAHAITAANADVSAEVIMHITPDSFDYPADTYVRARELRKLDVQVEQLQRILPRYTHLIADAFRPVFGTLNGEDIRGDLPALAEAGIKVALLSHGTDTRHPLHHMERNPYSLYFDAPEGFIGRRVPIVERNQETALTSGLPLYVTTPDLIDELPDATWVPLAVDVAAWATDRPVMERKRPVVLHAPSKRWTKGTDRFAPALQKMHDRGLIEFDIVEGLPWSEMAERVRSADIIVDQFAIGAYGTFACEAMAAGKPVIAWLSDGVSERVGPDSPILNTAPDKVADAVAALLDDRGAAAEVGARSAAYARRVHDGRMAAEVLLPFISS